MNWLGLTAANPALLWGTLLVGSPIIIHLLFRRKFKVVNWAAMEFLLDANRRNRRRIQLENLILLLLRCLAVILIALLVAKLMIRPKGLMAFASKTAEIEHIVVLDDSPSMNVRNGNTSPFSEAKKGLTEFIRRTADERPGDALTLFLTSQPKRPLINGKYMTDEKSEQLIRSIQALEPSDTAALFPQVLTQLETRVDGSKDANRYIYIITDQRRIDWQPEGSTPETGVTAILKRLSPKVSGVSIVDVSEKVRTNLSVTSLICKEKAIAAGVSCTFEAEISNTGKTNSTADKLSVTVGDMPPLTIDIDPIGPGSKVQIPIPLTFNDVGSYTVKASIRADSLPADNVRYLAVQVVEGSKILLVDGETSLEFGEAESFYLERALSPPGETRSPNKVKVITDDLFPNTKLDDYQVIVLCNVYRVDETLRDELEKWVEAGGSLAFFLGDNVDQDNYNKTLAGGKKLFPAELIAIKGDSKQQKWVNLSIDVSEHPVTRVFQGVRNHFLEHVKFYRWWQVKVRNDSSIQTIASFTSSGIGSTDPAMVEQNFGKGHVFVFTSSADAEWSNWPSSPSFVVSAQELARHLLQSTANTRTAAVGQPIRHRFDEAAFRLQARITRPRSDQIQILQAEPDEENKNMLFVHDDTSRAGFYKLELGRSDGSSETVIFARNIDAKECELPPADVNQLHKELADANIVFAKGRAGLGGDLSATTAGIWRSVAIALVLILACEQILAFYFAKRRG